MKSGPHYLLTRGTRFWRESSLATRFALTGGIVMLIAMLVAGRWVSARIEEGVVRNTANATAQYMESFISPLSQDLADANTLSPGARRALEEIFIDTPLGERVVSFKIWKEGGLVVEASDKAIIGQTFEITDNLRLAWQGEVRADFEDLSDAEDQGENALGLPLLEIYSPIREVWSGRIIGVAEFYEVAVELQQDLAEARRSSWAAVALLMLAIGASLYAIVRQGSRTIDRQRAALTQQLSELSALSKHNRELRLRVQNAAARASAMNDQALRRIGADLHDGPAQLLGFAALQMDHLSHGVTGKAAQQDLASVERAVQDAIREIRSISRGLSLPDIEARPPCEVVQGVVDAHAARTETAVDLNCNLPDALDLSAAIKICLFRFVQEGLNNAWRYAEGDGQQVRLECVDRTLRLSVRDRGPGFSTLPAKPAAADDFNGLGLTGLRDRVESLGGTFVARNRTNGGAEISMELEIREQ
ncbi:MAG: ATP-binding protein [Paracoccaceae bacterium]